MCQISQMHCTSHCSKHNHKTSSVLRIVTATIHSQNKFYILQLKYCKQFISEDYQCSTYTFKEVCTKYSWKKKLNNFFAVKIIHNTPFHEQKILSFCLLLQSFHFHFVSVGIAHCFCYHHQCWVGFCLLLCQLVFLLCCLWLQCVNNVTSLSKFGYTGLN